MIFIYSKTLKQNIVLEDRSLECVSIVCHQTKPKVITTVNQKPGKYKQVKIRREDGKETLARTGRFFLSYIEQENLLPRSFPPEIPHKTEFPFFFVTKSGMFGKSCEIKGLVSLAPCDIQEPSSKLDY